MSGMHVLYTLFYVLYSIYMYMSFISFNSKQLKKQIITLLITGPVTLLVLCIMNKNNWTEPILLQVYN